MNRDEGSYQLSHAYDRLLDATAYRRIKTRKNWVPASSGKDLVMRSKRQIKVLKFGCDIWIFYFVLFYQPNEFISRQQQNNDCMRSLIAKWQTCVKWISYSFSSAFSILKAKTMPMPIFTGRLCSGNGYTHANPCTHSHNTKNCTTLEFIISGQLCLCVISKQKFKFFVIMILPRKIC